MQKIERRRVADLKPYERNARTHSEAQISQIAASIQQWGWTMPVLVDEANGILAGHGRVMAAKQLGIEAVPAIVARDWTEAQKQAYVLADNQLALNAGWDKDLLRVEIDGLSHLGFDLGLIGFEDSFLAGLAVSPGLTDPDDVPEASAVPAAQLGDVWLLGGHRLVCGDCTQRAVVEACVGQEKPPHLMVSDPPYGVEYDPAWRRNIRNTFADVKADGVVQNDERVDWREAWALFDGDVAYVWHGGLHALMTAESLQASGFNLRAQIIWTKQMAPISRGDYRWQHEPCWYAVRKGRKGHWHGDRSQTTVWEIKNLNSVGGASKDPGDQTSKKHGTQKPVECMRRPIENNSKAGESVYDPFVGSGTTIIAAEMTGRRCFAIELNPTYVDICIRRWEQFTGKTAKEAGTNDTLEDRAQKVAA